MKKPELIAALMQAAQELDVDKISKAAANIRNQCTTLDELQEYLCSQDSDGNTALYKAVFALINKILMNDPLKIKSEIFKGLNAINIIASGMDTNDQKNIKGLTVHMLIARFSKIGLGTAFAKLPKAQQNKEYAFLSLRLILDINLRMRQQILQLATITPEQRAAMPAPVLVLEVHTDLGVEKFYRDDFSKYIPKGSIAMFGFEDNEGITLKQLQQTLKEYQDSPDNVCKVQAHVIKSKFTAIETNKIPAVACLDILPRYTEEENAILQTAIRGFEVVAIIRQIRDRGIVYNAIFKSIEMKGRILISVGLSHGIGIYEALQRTCKKPPECFIPMDFISSPIKVRTKNNLSITELEDEVQQLEAKGATVIQYGKPKPQTKKKPGFN